MSNAGGKWSKKLTSCQRNLLMAPYHPKIFTYLSKCIFHSTYRFCQILLLVLHKSWFCSRRSFMKKRPLKNYIAAIFFRFKQHPFLDTLWLFIHGGWNNKPTLNKWNKKVWYILEVSDLLITGFQKDKVAQIYYYDSQSAGMNVQSLQGKTYFHFDLTHFRG